MLLDGLTLTLLKHENCDKSHPSHKFRGCSAAYTGLLKADSNGEVKFGFENDEDRENIKFSSITVRACEWCPSGQYQNEPGQSECLDCPSGFFCPNAIIPDICPAGHKCPAKSTEKIKCEAGTFQPITQQSECSPCPDGYHCPAGSFEYKCHAEPGYFCKDDQSKMEKCPLHRY